MKNFQNNIAEDIQYVYPKGSSYLSAGHALQKVFQSSVKQTAEFVFSPFSPVTFKAANISKLQSDFSKWNTHYTRIEKTFDAYDK